MPPGPATRAAALPLRALRSLYFFEWWLLGMVVLEHLLFLSRGLGWMAWTFPLSVRAVWHLPLVALPAGMAAVAVWELARSRSRAGLLRCLAAWRTPGWWWVTLRVWTGILLTAHVYIWLKLFVPFLGGPMLDPWIWRIEEWAFLGYSPNRFILELFGRPGVLQAVDWAYSKVFLAGLLAGIAVFPVLLDNRLRAACTAAYAVMWTLGGWIHVLLPAMGPCYWFPSVWAPWAEYLQESVRSQTALLANFRELTVHWSAGPVRVNPLYGIAALPSMHNASQAMLALWVSRWCRPAGSLAWGSVALLFLGSVITGWHYLADGIAGLALAGGVFAAVRRSSFRRSA